MIHRQELRHYTNLVKFSFTPESLASSQDLSFKYLLILTNLIPTPFQLRQSYVCRRKGAFHSESLGLQRHAVGIGKESVIQSLYKIINMLSLYYYIPVDSCRLYIFFWCTLVLIHHSPDPRLDISNFPGSKEGLSDNSMSTSLCQ